VEEDFLGITDTLGNTRDELVNPTTNYNVVVVEQALKNNSKVALINTNVTRFGQYTDANVTGLEWNLRNNAEKYGFNGKFVSSQKFNDDGVDLGYSYAISLGKIAGAWTYNVYNSVESANYDINDLGFLFSPNEFNVGGSLAFNKFKPKNDKIANWSVSGSINYNNLYDPNVFNALFVNTRAFVRLKTFNAFGFWLFSAPLGQHNYFEPRLSDFSKYVFVEKNIGGGGFISTDYRKPVALDVNAEYERFDFTDKYYASIRVAPRFRLSSKIFIVPSFRVEKNSVDRGFVFFNSTKAPDLNLFEDIMIGERDVVSYNNAISGQFNITDKMSFNLQVNHYFSTVNYRDFYLLENAGKLNEYTYDAFDDEGNSIHDTNYNFFTINGVYTWRFAPGSDLIVSYKSNLTKSSESQSYFDNVAILGDFYRSSGLNLKALYYLDVNRLRTKS